MPNESELTGLSTDVQFRAAVLDAVLAGNESASAIMKHIGGNVALDGPRLRRLLDTGTFWQEVEKARLKVDERVIGWLKKHGLKYALKMDELTDNSDPRVAFQATKDVLDRIGTRPEQRVAVSNLDQYAALMKELMPPTEPPAEEPK